jgi:bifunctional non-homologous end joining protein LigD
MGLAEYKRKRRFPRTPEPPGTVAKKPGWSFAVQKHAASRLHYDFRLELDGVLKSWAVPKGPSLDPTQKRLAVQVEDHPVEYGIFEGTIPAGQYGGGTVLLWDRGRWEPEGDPRKGYRDGKLKFTLHGEKLHGGWMLIRGGKSRSADDGQWLLFKQRDEAARPLAQGDILEEAPLSVVSGRDLEHVATDADRVQPARIERAKKRMLPDHVDVQLATLTNKAPVGQAWLHEVKFDGYRMICRIEQGVAKFFSRNRRDWTDRLRPLAKTTGRLPVQDAILDGEVVALRPDGASDFQALQNAFREGRAGELRYFVFDLLHLNGHSLIDVPLEARKRALADLLGEGAGPTIRYSEHVDAQGPEFFRQACKLGLEGIISKRRDRPYTPGRGYDWLKIKCVRSEEFVIGGYTAPAGSRQGFGALLVGEHDQHGKLLYAGKVGTGFDARTLNSLVAELELLEQSESPFANLPRKTGPARVAHWVQPKLVAQISYGNRTREGRLRHPSYQGLREDKPAREVRQEQVIDVEQAVKAAKKPVRRRTAPANSAAQADKANRASGTRSRVTPSRKKPRGAKLARAEAATIAGYDARREQFHGVRLTSPGKVLYPEQGITKLELADYYRQLAPWILPHILHRPLVLVRCPEGHTKACFYQKHPGPGTPAMLRQIPIREKTKIEKYIVVDDMAGLVSLAQVGALEIHAWGSREDMLERPDRLVFDLDPDPRVPWPRVVAGARQVRAFLEELGLVSFLKTTGGKGLHVVVPIDRRHDWDEAKSFCKGVADAIVRADPGHYTANMAKAARPGKIFIDYFRNGRGATAVVPYSTRAKPGATVSVPLAWREINPRLRSDKFTIRNLAPRLARLKRDPWEDINEVRQSLAAPLKKLVQLGSADR